MLSADDLDRRQLNRATLQRQLLLERATLSPAEAVGHLVGLQAQAPLASYVALWSRLASFDPAVLGASHADRTRVKPDGRPVPLPPGAGAQAGTVLVDGDFRATWRLVRGDAIATVHVLADPKLSSSEKQDTIEEGLRLLGFLAPAHDQHEVIFDVSSQERRIR